MGDADGRHDGAPVADGLSLGPTVGNLVGFIGAGASVGRAVGIEVAGATVANTNGDDVAGRDEGGFTGTKGARVANDDDAAFGDDVGDDVVVPSGGPGAMITTTAVGDAVWAAPVGAIRARTAAAVILIILIPLSARNRRLTAVTMKKRVLRPER